MIDHKIANKITKISRTSTQNSSETNETKIAEKYISPEKRQKKNDSRRAYTTNSQIKLKTSMLKPSLCDYSDAYILAEGTITITEAER